jgi:hypothetical protein
MAEAVGLILMVAIACWPIVKRHSTPVPADEANKK